MTRKKNGKPKKVPPPQPEPRPTEGLPKTNHRISLWLIGLLAASLVQTINLWFLDKIWIQRSMQPPPAGVRGDALWGGIAGAASPQMRVFFDNDCYYWIRYAREMAHSGAWRIRETDADNVPYGRSVHWDSGFADLLVIAGKATSVVTGQTWDEGIEVASLWVNPMLFLGVIGLASWAVMRRWGGAAGGFFASLIVSFPSLQWDFGYGRPDHHGLHAAFFLGMLLCLILGGAGTLSEADGKKDTWWQPSYEQARRWFMLSGFLGAGGLWIGATQQAVLIGSVALGAFLMALFLAPDGERATRQRAQLWRIWSRTGALASLGFFLLEYFPSHMGMRLEVNHPLFALSWYAGGEVMARTLEWRNAGKAYPKRAKWLTGLFFVATLILPAFLLLGPAEWHALKDPYMRRLHEFIEEFRPLQNTEEAGFWQLNFSFFGLLPLLIPIAAAVLWWPRIPKAERQLLFLALVPAGIVGGLAEIQARWAGLWSVALTLLALAAIPALLSAMGKSEPKINPWLMGLAASLCLMPPWLMGLSNLRSTQIVTSKTVPQPLARAIAERDVALNLKRLAVLGDIRVMSGPSDTPSLQYFANIPGTASLYWENLQGLHDTVDFFTDESGETAKAIVQKRGITHVVVQQNDDFSRQMYNIRYGQIDEAALKRTLAWQLSSPLGDTPEWLEPVPFYGSPYAREFGMRIYRVLPRKL